MLGKKEERATAATSALEPGCRIVYNTCIIFSCAVEQWPGTEGECFLQVELQMEALRGASTIAQSRSQLGLVGGVVLPRTDHVQATPPKMTASGSHQVLSSVLRFPGSCELRSQAAIQDCAQGKLE